MLYTDHRNSKSSNYQMYVIERHTRMSRVGARAPDNASSVSETILGRNTKDVTVSRRCRRQRDVIRGGK